MFTTQIHCTHDFISKMEGGNVVKIQKKNFFLQIRQSALGRQKHELVGIEFPVVEICGLFDALC